MQYEEFEVKRKNLRISKAMLAKILGISRQAYYKWELRGEVPDRFVKKLYETFDDVKPKDFDFYSAENIRLNMKVYNMTMNETAKELGMSIASLNYHLAKGDSFYTYKRRVNAIFKPLIIPCVYNTVKKRLEVIPPEMMKKREAKKADEI